MEKWLRGHFSRVFWKKRHLATEESVSAWNKCNQKVFLVCEKTHTSLEGAK